MDLIKTKDENVGLLPLDVCGVRGGVSSFSEARNFRPFISVLVAVHNVSQYLNKCLNSLAVQTLQCVEFVVVDDGSTDSSAEICDKYQTVDTRFRIIHQENSGTLYSRVKRHPS